MFKTQLRKRVDNVQRRLNNTPESFHESPLNMVIRILNEELAIVDPRPAPKILGWTMTDELQRQCALAGVKTVTKEVADWVRGLDVTTQNQVFNILISGAEGPSRIGADH